MWWEQQRYQKTRLNKILFRMGTVWCDSCDNKWMNEWMRGKTESERTSRPNTQVSTFTTNDRTTTSTFPVKQPASATPFPNRLVLQYIIAVEWVGVGPQSRRRRRAEQLFPRARASQLTAWLTRWRLIANTYITYNSNLSTLVQLPQPIYL